jgi:hypothetical protein
MPTSTHRECSVPVVERARSFLRLVCDPPDAGRARQRTSDAAHAERLATLGSARLLTSISPASYARPGELLERASAPSRRCTPPGGIGVDAPVPASNDFLGKRTAPYLSETPVTQEGSLVRTQSCLQRKQSKSGRLARFANRFFRVRGPILVMHTTLHTTSG